MDNLDKDEETKIQENDDFIESFSKLSLEEKLKQILSSNSKVEIETVSNKEYDKKLEEKKLKAQESRLENEKSYLLQKTKIAINKINNKIFTLDKILNEIKRDSEEIIFSPKIEEKIKQLEKFQSEYKGFKKIFIFLDDIDVDKLNNLVEEKFK